MNYYFESEFFANSKLTPQQQEKPTIREMLKMAVSDVNKKNKKILENPLNQGSSNISDKQLQESKKRINQLNKEGEALSKKYKTDPAKLLVPVPKKDLNRIMPISDEIRKQALANAKQEHPELWVNDSKQILTDKPNDFDKPATESNYNAVLIIGITLFLLAILFIFNWRKSLFKRLIVVKNLIAQKIKIEDSNRAKKAFNLFGLIWILFHLFMLLTSTDIFGYNFSLEDFWVFNDWKDYHNPSGDTWIGIHYDISEFTIYVILPMIVIFAKKYLNGEPSVNIILRSSMKSNTDVQINDIKKYKELFDLGVISEAEFIEQKRKILNK